MSLWRTCFGNNNARWEALRQILGDYSEEGTPEGTALSASQILPLDFPQQTTNHPITMISRILFGWTPMRRLLIPLSNIIDSSERSSGLVPKFCAPRVSIFTSVKATSICATAMATAQFIESLIQNVRTSNGTSISVRLYKERNFFKIEGGHMSGD
jgi:hypothetical protein